MSKTKITWKTNVEKAPLVDMSEEEDFRTQILEKLSHKMIAMPFAPANDEVGILMSQFSKVEEPDTLGRGDFRLFSSYCGTERKNVKLSGCEILKKGETKRSQRLKKLPRVLSGKSECDIFTLKNAGVLRFYLPYRNTTSQPHVYAPDTSFSVVLEALSYDLYSQYLSKNDQADSKENREKFLSFLDNADAMEFVEEYKNPIKLSENHSGMHKNMQLSDQYREFCVIFRKFMSTEKEETVENLYQENAKIEALVEKHERQARALAEKKAQEEEAQRLMLEHAARMAEEAERQEPDPNMIILTKTKKSKIQLR